jgi:hypothetical protein
MATDADLPPHVLDVLNAGLGMATELQDYLSACGNAPPECTGCPGCQPARDAIYRWAVAVWTLRAKWGQP